MQTQVQVDTVTRLAAAPATRAELAALWAGVPICAQRNLPATVDEDAGLPSVPDVSPWAVGVLLADVLGEPIDGIPIIKAQCGRFVIAEYRPVSNPDPDILLSLIPRSSYFHDAMGQFQSIRQRMYRTSDFWYPAMKEAARGVLACLPSLNIHPKEAQFVVAWLSDVVAYGRDTRRGMNAQVEAIFQGFGLTR